MAACRTQIPGFALLCALLFSTLPLRAHNYPSEIEVMVGRTNTFQVADTGGCAAFVSAAVTGTALVSVTPNNGFGEIVEFTVIAGMTAGNTTITVQWIGADKFAGTDGPCQEDTTPLGRQITVKVIPEPEPDSTANNPTSAASGDPVNLFNGELFFHEPPDLESGGPLPLQFQRYYASRLRRNFVVGTMGDNWRHNFEWRLHWNGTFIALVTAEGKVLKYLKQGGNWTLQSQTDNPLQVIQVGTEIYVGDVRNNRIYHFNGVGRVLDITDRAGNKLYCTYDFNNNLTEVRDTPTATSTSRRLTFFYTSGKLTTVQEFHGFSSSRFVSFTYTGENLTSFRNAGNSFTTYVYDTDHADPGLLKWTVRPLGNIPWQNTWDAVGKVATQTDAYNNVTTYDYGPPQTPGTTVVTMPGNQVWTYIHNSDGSLTSMTNPEGQTIQIGATATRQRAQVTSAASTSISRNFLAANGNVTTETDENGNPVQFTYVPRTDANGIEFQDLVAITYPDGLMEKFEYDASGNLITHTNRAGEVWRYTYNASGQVLTELNPLGGTTTYTYDTRRNLATVTDPVSKVTTYSYDSVQRRNRVTWHDTSFRTFNFDAVGRLSDRSDENGNAIVSSYDANGNLIQVTDRRFNNTLHVYDFMDRLVSTTPSEGNGTTLTYDALGRIATITGPNTNTFTFTYNSRGQVLTVTDSLGLIEERTYDPAGRLVSVKDALDQVTLFENDNAGRLKKVTLPGGEVMNVSYDSLDRVTSVNLGGVGSATTYDDRGFPEAVVLPGGAVANNYSLDPFGQVTGVTDGNARLWTFQRDNLGRLTAAIDPAGKTRSFSYDDRHRISGITFPDSLGTVAYTYDAAGNLLRALYSDGTDHIYTYDEEGNLLTGPDLNFTYDTKNRRVFSNGVLAELDAGRRVSRLTFAVGKVVEFTHDRRDRLTRITDWVGGQTDFTYDAADRLLQIDRPNGISTLYTYDAAGGVTVIEEKQGPVQVSRLAFTHDARGLLTEAERTPPIALGAFSLAASDQQFTYTTTSQNSAGTYDSLGRLLGDGSRAYVWNAASRLVSYTEGATTVNFTYDGEGNRLSRNDGGTHHKFVWNYLFDRPCVAIIRDGADADLQYNVFTPTGELLYTIDASDARRFYHFDEHGNTHFVSDGSGNVLAAYRYTPYGEVLADSSGGAFANPFKYQGRYSVMAEGTTGLYYARARYYDSTTGRFLSRDPVHTFSALFFNPYQYAGGNPLLFRDPSGEEVTANDVASGAANGLAAGLGDVSRTRGGPITQTAAKLDRIAQAAGNGPSATRIAQNAQRVRTAGKVLDRVGYGAAVASAGLEAADLNNRLGDLRSRARDAEASMLGAAERLGREARDAFKAGRITYAQYEELLRNIDAALIAQLEGSSRNVMVDSVLESTKSLLKSVAGIAPVPGGVWDSYFKWLEE
ncbi:MAG: RHS repeat-associated core domain-containing protein [Verrucomicrobiota bacterium]